MHLNGRVAIVTGGASGIGEAIVKCFLREGATVVFIDTNQTQGQTLAKVPPRLWRLSPGVSLAHS